MNDPHSHSNRPLDYAAPGLMPLQANVVYVGGGLGIAGSFIGLMLFTAACFGMDAAFKLSLLPLTLGVAGILLSFFGAFFTRAKIEDTHVVAALFVNLFAIVGALLEVSVWMKWQLFQAA